MDRIVVSPEMDDKGLLEMVQLLSLGDIIRIIGGEIRKPCGLACRLKQPGESILG
jgi:hypothetical protein